MSFERTPSPSSPARLHGRTRTRRPTLGPPETTERVNPVHRVRISATGRALIHVGHGREESPAERYLIQVAPTAEKASHDEHPGVVRAIR